ncbi:MAG: hypothetical protein JWR07_1701, partial [Nevskia sp.]|nr:hypothetical protein [Nevskia sp.]
MARQLSGWLALVSRRKAPVVLVCGMALAAAAALGACSNSSDNNTSGATACEALSGWPTAALSAANATTVDPTQFITAAQLNTWGVDLDNR